MKTLETYDHWIEKSVRVNPGTAYRRRASAIRDGERVEVFSGPFTVHATAADDCTGKEVVILETPDGTLVSVTLLRLATHFEVVP